MLLTTSVTSVSCPSKRWECSNWKLPVQETNKTFISRTLDSCNNPSHTSSWILWSTREIKQKPQLPGTEPISYLFIVFLMSKCCILPLLGIRLAFVTWLNAEWKPSYFPLLSQSAAVLYLQEIIKYTPAKVLCVPLCGRQQARSHH